MAERQPRAVIILASAQIDTQLRHMLEAFMWPRTGKTKEPDELLDGEGSLSTFSSRIKMSVRLGIIDASLATALEKLREVRNQAAHWISFGVATPPLSDQLKHLQSLVAHRNSYRLTVSKFFGSNKLNGMESLQAVLLTLSALLGSIHDGMATRSLPKLHKPIKLD